MHTRNHRKNVTLALLILTSCTWAASCGDDDGDDCVRALQQFDSAACQAAATGAVEAYHQCVVDAEPNCLANWNAAIQSCFLGSTPVLFDGCDACYQTCANTFNGTCIGTQGKSGQACWNELIACKNGC